jgi:hypothetical protein
MVLPMAIGVSSSQHAAVQATQATGQLIRASFSSLKKKENLNID